MGGNDPKRFVLWKCPLAEMNQLLHIYYRTEGFETRWRWEKEALLRRLHRVLERLGVE